MASQGQAVPNGPGIPPRFSRVREPPGLYDPESGVRLMECFRQAIRTLHYSRRTEDAYRSWIRRFILFHGKKHPLEMGEREIEAFLSDLAVRGGVSSSTQGQALSALLFLYRRVLGREVDPKGSLARARTPKRLPTVLSRDEIRAVYQYLDGSALLMVSLLYGAGLRLGECLNLRIRDIDLGERRIFVRQGKGGKDRVTILPVSAVRGLRLHLRKVQRTYRTDLDAGADGAPLPDAVLRRTPRAGTTWSWQFVFPAERLSRDPRTGRRIRNHAGAKALSLKIRRAARLAEIERPVHAHTFRHSFATHLLADGYDIRTVQELLGHENVSTTMMYTHVVPPRARGVRSPGDDL